MLAHHFAQAAPVERPGPRDRLRAGRRPARGPAAGLGGGRAALPRGAAGARARRARSTTTCAPSCCSPWAPPRTARGWRRRRARRSTRRSARRAQLGDAGAAGARRAGRGGAVVGAVALGPGAGGAARRGAGRRCPRRTRRCARGCSPGMSLELYYAGEPELRLSLSRGGRGDRAPDRRPAHAGDVPRRPPLRAVAAGERRGAAGGRGRAAARGRGDRRPGARAAGRRLDDHRPDGARRHRGRRHPDRRRLEARRGAPPADLAVVDVAVPRRAGAARRATSTTPSGSPRRRWRSASAARPRTPCTTTRRRCSTSAASRAGSAEVEGAVRGFIELYPAIPAWRAALALMLVELGPPGRGARRVRGGRRGRLRGLPARRQLADRDHADWPRCAARWRDALARRGALRAAASRTRAATSSSAATRPATAPPRACSACSPSAPGRVRAPSAAERALRWARAQRMQASCRELRRPPPWQRAGTPGVAYAGDAAPRRSPRPPATARARAREVLAAHRASVGRGALGRWSCSTERGAAARARAVRTFRPLARPLGAARRPAKWPSPSRAATRPGGELVRRRALRSA